MWETCENTQHACLAWHAFVAVDRHSRPHEGVPDRAEQITGQCLHDALQESVSKVELPTGVSTQRGRPSQD